MRNRATAFKKKQMSRPPWSCAARLVTKPSAPRIHGEGYRDDDGKPEPLRNLSYINALQDVAWRSLENVAMIRAKRIIVDDSFIMSKRMANGFVTDVEGIVAEIKAKVKQMLEPLHNGDAACNSADLYHKICRISGVSQRHFNVVLDMLKRAGGTVYTRKKKERIITVVDFNSLEKCASFFGNDTVQSRVVGGSVGVAAPWFAARKVFDTKSTYFSAAEALGPVMLISLNNIEDKFVHYIALKRKVTGTPGIVYLYVVRLEYMLRYDNQPALQQFNVKTVLPGVNVFGMGGWVPLTHLRPMHIPTVRYTPGRHG